MSLDIGIYNAIDGPWQKNQPHFFEVNPPDQLFHYLTANGLKNVLENCGMFASPTFSMNDPSELNYCWEIVEEVCIEYAQSKKVEEKELANAILRNRYFIKKEYPPEYPVLGLVCFSEAADDLSQWRSYADNGNGFAIEFNTRILQQQKHPWEFYKCIYEKEEQKKLIDRLFHLILSVRGSLTNKTLESIVEVSVGYVWQLASVIKHKAYIAEQEWRLRTHDLSGATAFVSGSGLRASRKIEIFDESAIKRLVIGPKNNFESAEFALKTLLKNTLFNKAEIVRSDAPYR
jgi:hypothetical protein